MQTAVKERKHIGSCKLTENHLRATLRMHLGTPQGARNAMAQHSLSTCVLWPLFVEWERFFSWSLL